MSTAASRSTGARLDGQVAVGTQGVVSLALSETDEAA